MVRYSLKLFLDSFLGSTAKITALPFATKRTYKTQLMTDTAKPAQTFSPSGLPPPQQANNQTFSQPPKDLPPTLSMAYKNQGAAQTCSKPPEDLPPTLSMAYKNQPQQNNVQTFSQPPSDLPPTLSMAYKNQPQQGATQTCSKPPEDLPPTLSMAYKNQPQSQQPTATTPEKPLASPTHATSPREKEKEEKKKKGFFGR